MCYESTIVRSEFGPICAVGVDESIGALLVDKMVLSRFDIEAE